MPIIVTGSSGPTPLHFGRDDQGYNAFAPALSVNKIAANLMLANETTFTVPTTAKTWVIAFSYVGAPAIWVTTGTTTTQVPSGNTFAPINSVLNPASLTVEGGTILRAVTSNTTDFIGVSMYAQS